MTGDIWLQKRSGWVGWFVSLFTRSDWVHVGIDMGDGTIVHADWRGKRFTEHVDWALPTIVLTPLQPLNELNKTYLVMAANNEPVKGYDYLSAVKSWFWKNTDDEKPTGKRYHCSEFVSAVYRKIGIDLVPNRSDDTTQPQDFLTSPYLKKWSLYD